MAGETVTKIVAADSSLFTELLRESKGSMSVNIAGHLAFLRQLDPMGPPTKEEAERMARLDHKWSQWHRCERPKSLLGAEVIEDVGDDVTFLLPDGRTVRYGVSGYEYDEEWEEHRCP